MRRRLVQKNAALLKENRSLSPYPRLKESEKIVQDLLQVSEEQMKIYLKEAAKASLHFSYPAIAYFINQLGSTSYFLPQALSSYLHKINISKNSADPITFLALALNSERVVCRDDNFEALFGSTTHVMYMVSSIVQFLQVRRLTLPLLLSAGSIWLRSIYVHQGKRYTMKTFARRTGEGAQEAFCQLELDFPIEDQALDKLML
eukprot:snap_masked-scaffold_14-processed-gene-10.41-mRNA-1 protein AED:1.00 eAED:1.00 QI:0/0/0/0/1/1/3/0/202